MDIKHREEVQLYPIYFFADDSVFFRANLEECKTLKEILTIYQKASGQEVNYTKSTVAFSKGIHLTEQQILKEMIGVDRVGGFGRYLGLPERIGRKCKDVFEFIKQRIMNKIDTGTIDFFLRLEKKFYSRLSFLSLLYMPCLVLCYQMGLLNQTTSYTSNFWWSSFKDRHKIPWVSGIKALLQRRKAK